MRDDIRHFWDRTLVELADTPMGEVVEPVEQTGYILEGNAKTLVNYRVTLTSLGGVPIRAWYTVPTGDAPSGGWPAVMVIPGYIGVMVLPVHLVRYGYATLTLYPRGQGESREEWTIPEGSTALTDQLEDKEAYYYRGGFMDCVRGLDFLLSRPEINAQRVGVLGSSQGGGMTLATASLDRRIGAAVAEVPWPCNFPVAAERTFFPYDELRGYLERHPERREQILANLEFFDPMNLVEAITCPMAVGVALHDDYHPYETSMPVFERIPPTKSLHVYADIQTMDKSDFAVHTKAWFDRYLR